ncbi:MAG: TonB-dependent receptor, partial [Calditrichia bacterium]|nr:TonB-dependent receptor [Calditrichia bacterium]
LKKFSVNGYIFDSATSEPLAHANVMIKGTKQGTNSDQNGYFDLTNVSLRQNRLMVHYMGYHPEEIILKSDTDSNPIHIKLRKQVLKGEEIQVTASRNLLSLNNSDYTSQLILAPSLIKNLSSLGEYNVFQAIKWTPGVSGVNDDISGLRVRGGTNDQNLVLFDGIPIYQTDHFFGLVSGFNSEAIHGIQFYRGGFPAKYGGRTSSVLLLNGNSSESFQTYMSAGINLLSANANLNMRIGEKVSFSIAGRRSYMDIIDNGIYRKLRNYVTQLDTSSTFSGESDGRSGEKKDIDLYYYDINSKLTVKPTKNDVISLNLYKGHDFLDQSYSFTEEPRYEAPVNSRKYTDISKWGNIGTNSSWQHRFNNKYAISLGGCFSRFVSNTKDGFNKNAPYSEINSKENSIEELSLKLDNSFANKDDLQFDYGIHLIRNKVQYEFTTNEFITHFMDNTQAFSSVGYLQSIWKLKKKLAITSGVRFTHYSIDKNLYTEPRLSFACNIHKQLKFTGAYSHHYQFVNQIKSGNILTAHQQQWVLAGSLLKPEFAEHIIAGAHWDAENYLFSVEAYFKNLENVKEYIFDDFTDYLTRLNRKILHGSGGAKGIEFLAMKKHSNFSGWLSYTLGKVEYKIPFINNGFSFPADHDRRHELKWVSIYHYKKWNMGITWLYSTGAHYTPLFNSSDEDGYTIGLKNSEKLPDYHRMDANISRKFYYHSMIIDLGVSVYNLYDKQNILSRNAIIDYREGIHIRDTKMLG